MNLFTICLFSSDGGAVYSICSVMFSHSARQSDHHPEYQQLDSSLASFLSFPAPTCLDPPRLPSNPAFPRDLPSLLHPNSSSDTPRRDQSLIACESVDQLALRGAASLHPAGTAALHYALCSHINTFNIPFIVCVCVLDKRAHKSMPAFEIPSGFVAL